jgi:sensor histidine kinase YesM
MTPNQRFTLIITLLTVLISAVGYLIKLLWTTSARWQQLTDRLQHIGEQIADLVIAKEKEHTRIEARLDKHDNLLYNQQQRQPRRREQQ